MTLEQTVIITKLMNQYQILGSSSEDPVVLDLGEGTTVEIRTDGTQCWFRRGEPSSEGEPHLNGQLHRIDGAAVIYADGSQRWWLNGQRHRIDGAAVIWADGSQFWWLNGQRHRTDGPASIYADGSQRWWLNGEAVTQKEHTQRTTSERK